MRRAAAILAAAVVVALPTTAQASPARYAGPCHAAIERHFGGMPSFAARWHYIAHRESRGIPTAVNPSPLHASGCVQILPRYARPFLRMARCSSLLVADCNIRAAYAMWTVAGWRPWATR